MGLCPNTYFDDRARRGRPSVGIGVPRPIRKCSTEIGGRIVIGRGRVSRRGGEWANRLEIVTGNDVVFADPIEIEGFFFPLDAFIFVVLVFAVLGVVLVLVLVLVDEVDEVLALGEIHYLLVHERRRIHRCTPYT